MYQERDNQLSCTIVTQQNLKQLEKCLQLMIIIVLHRKKKKRRCVWRALQASYFIERLMYISATIGWRQKQTLKGIKPVQQNTTSTLKYSRHIISKN